MAYWEDLVLDRAWRPAFSPKPFAGLWPAGLSSAARSVPDHRPPSCPEIDCVRAHLPWQTIATAEHRAAELGTGADRVLIAKGAIDEDRYLTALRALARRRARQPR